MLTKTLALLMVLIISMPPCWAKAVSLDVQHLPGQEQYRINKPYFIDARKHIEANWQRLDPVVGETVTIRFILRPDGVIEDYYPVPPVPPQTQTQDAALRMACLSIQQSNPLPPIPAGNGVVAVHAEFKSRRPVARVDPSKLGRALEYAAIAALVGFSIYAICKWGGSSRSVSGIVDSGNGRSCVGAANCTHCSSCRYCAHCTSRGSPCNVWYFSR